MTDETELSEWKRKEAEANKMAGFSSAEHKESEPNGESAIEEKPSRAPDATRGIKPSLRRPTRGPVVVPQVRDEVTIKIEKILEEGVGDSYNRLSPVAKQEFKLKGEQTALAIQDLLKSAHVKVKNIFRLIFEWLKMLPGINNFYLEQEAKIKTDRILAVHEHKTKK